MKQSETELNELLSEYWKLRHEAGRCPFVTPRNGSLDSFSDLYMEIISNKLTEG